MGCFKFKIQMKNLSDFSDSILHMKINRPLFYPPYTKKNFFITPKENVQLEWKEHDLFL